MRLFINGSLLVSLLLLCGCSMTDGDAAARPKAELQSVYTDLGGASCRKKIDKTDPNETRYLACPGVGGYTLNVRRVDAGRRSIDIVDPAQRAFPLNYQEFVTRHMFTLDGQAEWRVLTKDGRQAPVALIVRVLAHEDNDNPEKVTRTYLTVAKITADGACVTDRIPESTRSEAEVRSTADSAQMRPCAPPRPPMTVDGAVIR
jgi:hypothetical protein